MISVEQPFMAGLETEVHLEPLDAVLDLGPKLVGTTVRQFRWWLMIVEYYQGNQPRLGGDLVNGLMGEETRVTKTIDASEFFPKGISPFLWSRKLPGMYLALEHPQDVRLAKLCNLTERGPLPILPLPASRSFIPGG